MMRLIVGDSLTVLKTLPEQSVQTCITSPPYWGLRDYGVAGQLGLEPTPALFVETMVQVFREVRRVLRDDGTLWLNLGDSYNSFGGNSGKSIGLANCNHHDIMPAIPARAGLSVKALKNKDLVGIPWMVAFALRADGWYLRQDIIWQKPNPMPESITDRCTKAHEYIFLLSKSARYRFDAKSISEPCSQNTHARMRRSPQTATGLRAHGGNERPFHAGGRGKLAASGSGIKSNESFAAATAQAVERRNKRSVWTVGTQAYKGAHFATFPPKLIEPCVLAGAARGDLVLDPFAGTCTTGYVAAAHGRDFLGIELNPEYAKLAANRVPGLEVEIFAAADLSG